MCATITSKASIVDSDAATIDHLDPLKCATKVKNIDAGTQRAAVDDLPGSRSTHTTGRWLMRVVATTWPFGEQKPVETIRGGARATPALVSGMSSFPAPRHRYTYAEYLSVDEQGTHKHEYFDGEIYAMAGGTPAHAALTAAFVGSLYAQLQGKPCRVYSSDLRIRVLETGLATYPDASVVCGPIEGDPAAKDTATNPKLIVEVLSDSTEAYDRGAKRKHYQRIPSLEQYVLVSQHERQVEVWRRSGHEWSSMLIEAGGRIQLDSIECFVDIDALYAAL